MIVVSKPGNYPHDLENVHVIKAGPKFEQLGTNQMGEVIMATPAISDGMIIVRGMKHVFGIAAPVVN